MTYCQEYLRSVGGTISLSSLSFRGKGLPYVTMRSTSVTYCQEYLRSVGGTISLSSLSFRGKGLP